MSADSPLQPPPEVRGMTELHRAAFCRCLRVPALRLPAQGGVSKLLKLLRPQLMRMPGIRPVLTSAEAAALAPSAPGHGDVSGAAPGHGDVSDGEPGHGDVSGAAPGHGDVSGAAPGHGDVSGAEPDHGDVSGAAPGHGDVSGAAPGHGDVSGAAPGHGDISGAAPGHKDVSGAAPDHGDVSGAAPDHGDVSGAAPGHGDVSGAEPGHGDVSGAAPGHGDVSGAAPGHGDVSGAAPGHGDVSDVEPGNGDVGDPSRNKVALLDPDQVSGLADLPWPQLAEHGVHQHHFCRLPVQLTYENFSAEAVLRAVIPADQQSVTGFSRIGHLIHLNLKDHTLPYGKLIGTVLMDKQKGVKCVVNKLNTIDNTFRNFSMDVLAGEADFVVEAKENGCTFRMDFSKVYWNPRLSTEHQRIVDMLAPADVVADVFAGIGPFTVPAAKKGHRVIANDLNPDSVHWLRHNVAANKVKGSVDIYNQDGREFIGGPLRAELRTLLERGGGGRMHAVCNLPALAIDFMDSFLGLLSDGELAADAPPPLRVHVHTFTKEVEEAAEREVVASLSSRVGCDVSAQVQEVLMVRNVAPNKLMYRVSWDVPPRLLCSSTSTGPPLKKARVGGAEEQPTAL